MIAVVCNDSQLMFQFSIISVWLHKCGAGQGSFDPFWLDVACGNNGSDVFGRVDIGQVYALQT